MIILQNVHESLGVYPMQIEDQKDTTRVGELSLFSGFLRCGDCGSNLHYHFNQVNPNIEYYNCSNYDWKSGNMRRYTLHPAGRFKDKSPK